MKKLIYLASWLVLTATDAILGYKTAVADFGIESRELAIIWALGFSLMSVPLKVIYDRTIEQAYKGGTATGKATFLVFSCLWLFVCYNAYTGISELRKRDMNRLQLATFKSGAESKPSQQAEISVTNTFDYRLARKRLNMQAKQDSAFLANQAEEQREFRTEQKKLMQESNGKGFLYFNLLLILSASICLSLGLEEEQEKKEETRKEEIEKVEPAQIEEPKAEQPAEQNTVVTAEVYTCNGCKREFNRYGYNGHFRGNTHCTKGDFTKNF